MLAWKYLSLFFFSAALGKRLMHDNDSSKPYTSDSVAFLSSSACSRRREKTVVLKVRNAYQPVDVTYFAYRCDGLDTRRRSLGLEISADEARRVMERTSERDE